MIEFVKDPQNTIPSSLVKIIGLGGAGANMLDRVALDGIEGAEMLALNADIRTLAGSVAAERIQLGVNLTKGLGTGGDPDLGQKVMMEAEKAVRSSIKGRKIVFLCVGLGGGTGSGGAPILTRIAREEGAFVVIFATMPFAFEGRRRREQAETALNELAVLSNALVVFDNTRMGELVLAKQGIHEAFSAGDRMISDSIKAVIRLVIRPGLIHVGLDELMTALRTTRSRCLFGSGTANGKDRASKALANALASPLLDKGALLKEAASVLVHICGGEDLTLYEIELLMQKLAKYVPQKAHVLFGAAIDTNMKDALSITLISALPEEKLQASSLAELPEQRAVMEPSEGFGFDDPPQPVQNVEQPVQEPVVDEPDKNKIVETVPSAAAVPQVNEWVDFQESDDHVVELPFAEPEQSDNRGDFSPQGGISPANFVTEAARDFRDALMPPEPRTEEEEKQPVPAVLGDLLEKTRIRLGQNDMLFEGSARGKFADTESNLVDGDDLDIPPFMRKKKK
ncbi:MAG: cell division FtsZ family protein [Verrucomicrobia bacterium]|nr:cell division FtsZ family protein [Verrucomicrobiota bacterium]